MLDSFRTSPPPFELSASPASDGAASVPLSAFLSRTGTVLRAGWPDALWVEATVLRVTSNAGGHALELIDPGPRGAVAGQLRAFLPGAMLPGIRRDLGLSFDPAQLVGLTAVMRLAPDFDPKWHLQARILGLARSLQASLTARLLADARERLRREGYLSRQGRLPRPADVTRLAVVHPAGSAGLADVERELRVWMAAGLIAVRFVVAPFEGMGAAVRIAEAVRRATEPIGGFPPDLVLLVRGGGSRSGLVALDDETLARTVATLPVPVVTGLGHATDRALVDAVAFRAADTPSKALAIVRDLLCEPARRACADRGSIGVIAVSRLEAAEGDLTMLQERVYIGVDRVLNGADRTLATVWADMLAKTAETHRQADTLAGDLDRQFEHARDAGPVLLERAATEGERLLRAVSEVARQHVAQAPDAAIPHAIVLSRAIALVATAEREGERLLDTIVASTLRHLDHHDALLQQAASGLADLDHAAVIGRGYVLARDTTGRVLATRDAAIAARSFILEFGDGALAVVAVSPQPVSP